MSNSDIKTWAAIVAGAAASAFGLVLIAKILVAIWQASFAISGFVLTLLVLALQAVTFIFIILGTAIAVLALVAAVVWLTQVVTEQVNGLKARAPEGSKIVPVCVAGAMAVVTATLSEHFGLKVKVLLLISLGILSTLLLFAINARERAARRTAFTSLALGIVVVTSWLGWRFGLHTAQGWRDAVAAVRLSMATLSLQDSIGLGVVAGLFAMMLYTAVLGARLDQGVT